MMDTLKERAVLFSIAATIKVSPFFTVKFKGICQTISLLMSVKTLFHLCVRVRMEIAELTSLIKIVVFPAVANIKNAENE